ncbi:MAG: hypothetical protein HRT99_04285 [Mycoplasmatales bacterium]|nr:hypothetical protein [Mycoplasmatales bacterium]
MNKIDLHIHTKHNPGEPNDKRYIEPIDFKKIMKNAGISIASITNHNDFNVEYFEKYKGDSYLLLPGVELDVNDSGGKRFQVNVIFDALSAKNLEKKIKNKLISPKNCLSREEFINLFKDEKCILFFDYKSGETRIDIHEYENMIDEMNFPASILDSNNVKTQRLLMAHEYNSLIGSDLKDWSNYVEKDSIKLLSTNLKIDNFRTLYLLLKSDKDTLSNLIKNIDVNEYKIDIEGDKFDIKVAKDLNVIIGDKATGKTKILNQIYDLASSKGINVSRFLTENKEDVFKDIMNESSLSENVSSKYKKIEEYMDSILSIKNSSVVKPSSIKDFLEQEDKSGILIQNTKSMNELPVDFSKIENFLKSINNLINDIDKIKWTNELSMDLFKKNVNEKRREIIDWFIRTNIIKINSIFVNKVVSELKKIIDKGKGIKPDISSTGLFEEFSNKKTTEDLIEKINRMSFNDVEIKESFHLQDVGEIKLAKTYQFTPPSKKLSAKNKIHHNVYDWNKNVFPLFSRDFSYDNLDKFKNYWNDNKDKKILKAKMAFYNKDELPWDRTPSTGQRSMIVLQKSLNKDADMYILDEPSVHLGSNVVTEIINKKIAELKRSKKTIIIATHNSSLALNSVPFNLVFRDSENNGYKTYYSNIASDEFVSLDGKKKNFNDVVIKILEGGDKALGFRRGIYEGKYKN